MTAKKHSFQAEVKQVLDIVIHSLYTHRDIFVRELISNATDALEKFRYESVANHDVIDAELPLNIKITVDEDAKTLIFTDTGIGMTEDEAVSSLGTIAHSGTREFLKHSGEDNEQDINLIGQFGVGFYSAFMVAKQVTVQTRSFHKDSVGVEWISGGAGDYTIETKDGLLRGTKIILELRDDAEEFSTTDKIKSIVKEYSNFVPFPIVINDEEVNTIQAIWTRNKNEIKDEEYNEFYKFIANEHDDPVSRLHFSADAPLQINALMFIPKTNIEQFGFGRMDPGVNLYCRRVLIQSHCDTILPEWLRFVKGVVDSEDLPLNISRETFQDNALIQKLRKVITSRLIKFLKEQASKEPDAYLDFYKNFSNFIKEGATSDYEYRTDIAPLLRFESSRESGQQVSLDEYVSRMMPDQKAIYYLTGPSRDLIESSPYMESLRKYGFEVFYCYEAADDFVLNGLREYDGKKLISADQDDLELPNAPKEDETQSEEDLSSEQTQSLADWLKETLSDQVVTVKTSTRLVDSPAMIVNTNAFMTSSMQRVMQAINKDAPPMGKQTLEINPQHPIMQQLANLRENNADTGFLKLAAEQLFDNAMAAAGLIPDPRSMVNRNYAILEQALKQSNKPSE